LADDRVIDQPRLRFYLLRQRLAHLDFFFERKPVQALADVAIADFLDIVFALLWLGRVLLVLLVLRGLFLRGRFLRSLLQFGIVGDDLGALVGVLGRSRSLCSRRVL